jgi:hypothetical protein
LIEVIDILGRVHFSQSYDVDALASGTEIIPDAPLYDGVYFVRATQAQIKARKKILVKN